MKKTICLNMIVKDESHVIERCLESVKPIIDHWVIVDTGSQDGTQDKIKQIMKNIPGELHERPWVDFGHNRNEALFLAQDKSDYIFFIDADDRLVFSEDFTLPELEADGYWMIQKEASGSFFKEHNLFCLMKNGADIKWKGVLHEYLFTSTPKDVRKLEGVFNEYINDGNRSKDPQKIQKEIQILEKAIENEPLNIRYRIYIARAYWFLEDYHSALEHFEKGAQMTGTEEELYYCLLYIAICQNYTNSPSEMVINSFCTAHLFRASRAEASFQLASYYINKKNPFLAYLMAKTAMQTPRTTDTLFVESWIYDWGASVLFFECSKAIGAFGEALSTLDKLLKNPDLPPDIRQKHRLDEWHSYFTTSLSIA